MIAYIRFLGKYWPIALLGVMFSLLAGAIISSASVLFPPCGDIQPSGPPSFFCYYHLDHSTETVTDARPYFGVYPDYSTPATASTSGSFSNFQIDNYAQNFFWDFQWGGQTHIYQVLYSGGVWSPPALSDTSTHFIELTPIGGDTYSTTTSVGFQLNLSDNDYESGMKVDMRFVQDSEFACENSGAVYDAVVTCTGPNAPAAPFRISIDPLSLLKGYNNFASSTTFPAGGNWTGTYTIRVPHIFGLFYTDLISSTTSFTIGQPSAMDNVRTAIETATGAQASSTRNGIGAILASTTANLGSACSLNPLRFSMGDCITLLFWPGPQAIADDFLILKETPPWGYIFRVIDILRDTPASTTLPSIDYAFASSSPMAVVGDIHFDPFNLIAQSGTLVNEMHSDRPDGANVWQIFMPAIRIFIYLVLGFMIVHDLTGIHSDPVARRNDKEGK